MEFTIDDAINVVLIIGGLLGIYTSFKTKLAVLEREVSDLRDMVSELRLDIKNLLTRK